MDLMVNTRQIAKLLNVSPRKIPVFIRQGMPFSQSGKRNLYFSPALVDKWVQSQMKTNCQKCEDFQHI